jgi:hypothetical protein
MPCQLRKSKAFEQGFSASKIPVIRENLIRTLACYAPAQHMRCAIIVILLFGACLNFGCGSTQVFVDRGALGLEEYFEFEAKPPFNHESIRQAVLRSLVHYCPSGIGVFELSGEGISKVREGWSHNAQSPFKLAR